MLPHEIIWLSKSYLHLKVQVVILFFQQFVFGNVGQLGHLVPLLAGAEPVLDLAPRLNAGVELVQDPEVTANLAVNNLVQVSKIQHLLIIDIK